MSAFVSSPWLFNRASDKTCAQTDRLGREDSNLRMAESKSTWFRSINTHSEKSRRFDFNGYKRLADRWMSAHLGTRRPTLLRGTATERSPAWPKINTQPPSTGPIAAPRNLLWPTRKGSQAACVCPRTSLTSVSDGKAQLFRTGETFSPFVQRCRVRARSGKLRNIYARPLYAAGTGSRRRPRHSRRPHLGG
jgi:hypothetical protein